MNDVHTDDGFRQARDLLTQPREVLAVDERLLVTYMLTFGGPTTYVELVYVNRYDYDNGDAPEQATFIHRWGAKEYRYSYASDELDLLWATLNRPLADD